MVPSVFLMIVVFVSIVVMIQEWAASSEKVGAYSSIDIKRRRKRGIPSFC